jgi:hypothetical protein
MNHGSTFMKAEKRIAVAAWIKLAGIAGIVAAVILALTRSGLTLSDFTHEKIRSYILGYGPWAPLIFILLYAQKRGPRDSAGIPSRHLAFERFVSS